MLTVSTKGEMFKDLRAVRLGGTVWLVVILPPKLKVDAIVGVGDSLALLWIEVNAKRLHTVRPVVEVEVEMRVGMIARRGYIAFLSKYRDIIEDLLLLVQPGSIARLNKLFQYTQTVAAFPLTLYATMSA